MVPFIQSYLVALVPLVFLWLHNWTDVFFPEIFLWACVLLLCTSIIFSATLLIVQSKNLKTVELICCTALFFTFYFGYFCSYDSWWFKALYSKGLISLKILLPIWILLAIVVIIKITALNNTTLIKIVQLKRKFVAILIFLLLSNFLPILLTTSSLKEFINKNKFFDQETTIHPTSFTTEQLQKKPNIYYIILDAYPRHDTIKELYEYDNTPFLHTLEEFGFIICKKSCSNYPTTAASIPSTLSMNYLPYNHKTNKCIAYSITNFFEQNPVFNFFKNNDYSLVNISGYDCFTAKHPDAINISSQIIALTTFSGTFIDKTILGPLWYKLYINYCGRNLIKQLDSIHKALMCRSPKFVFVHVLCPHEPYYLTAEGNPRTLDNHDLLTPKGHLETVIGISKRMIPFIQSILDKEPYSIIILQSDHGSQIVHKKDYITDSTFSPSIIKERIGILNAFYFPPSLRPDTIPQTITSVNTFRFVLSILTQKPIPFLEEKIFFYPLLKEWNADTKVSTFNPKEINNSQFIK